MKSFFKQVVWLLAVAFAPVAAAADAAALLTGMAGKLTKAERFSVTMVIRYDSVQATGQLIEFSERRDMVVQRPQKMRIDTRQSDGESSGLILDGSLVTQFNVDESVYAQLEQPGNLDDTIRYAVKNLGIRIPLARLLVSDLAAELGRNIERVALVETNQLGEEPIEHIAAVGASVDAQFWIRPDMLPARIVLVYRDTPGQPRFSADFSDWNLQPEIGQGTFRYDPPRGAEKIPVLLRGDTSGAESAESKK